MFFRFIKISQIALKYFVFFRFTDRKKICLGERLREACCELGLTFIKIGQILSMRYDLLSKEDCKELQQLLDNINPLPYEVIHDILQKEFKAKPEKIFKRINKKPVASASISQVHKGVLKDGTIVAIKIKRPGVEDTITHDVQILRLLAYIARIFSKTLRHLNILSIVDRFEYWLQKETDFLQEIENISLVKHQYLFAADPNNKFDKNLGVGVWPEVYGDLCTPNVIVMDFINGIPLSKADTVADDPDYDIQQSIKTFICAAVRNVFISDQIAIQADPHLSNIMALKHGNVSNIDCGLIEVISRRNTRNFRNLFLAVHRKDLKETVKVSLAICELDYEKYRPVIENEMKEYLEKTTIEGVGFWFMDIARIFVTYGLPLNNDLLAMGRSISIFDTLIEQFFPGHSAPEIIGDELKTQAIQEIMRNIREIDYTAIMYSLTKKLKESPEIVETILDDPLYIIREIKKATTVST